MKSHVDIDLAKAEPGLGFFSANNEYLMQEFLRIAREHRKERRSISWSGWLREFSEELVETREASEERSR